MSELYNGIGDTANAEIDIIVTLLDLMKQHINGDFTQAFWG